ncbi:hypothetical protein [Actinomadura sp. CNU-125]|uniref:hypothetical protein n=1 Tax=Actinomadura sp. CNU-125 TaxID=1904961 RepID=UPI000A95D53C|nr:hypothetical protein [Actinomadura sp. CNU-125]
MRLTGTRLTNTRLLDGVRAKVLAALGTTAVLATAGLVACSGGGEQEREPVGVAKVASTLGPGEGVLNLVTLPGYIENGGNDPRVDWVTPFEERTGCKIGWKVVTTPREMADLMRDGGRHYDGVAARPRSPGGSSPRTRSSP